MRWVICQLTHADSVQWNGQTKFLINLQTGQRTVIDKIFHFDSSVCKWKEKEKKNKYSKRMNKKKIHITTKEKKIHEIKMT